MVKHALLTRCLAEMFDRLAGALAQYPISPESNIITIYYHDNSTLIIIM